MNRVTAAAAVLVAALSASTEAQETSLSSPVAPPAAQASVAEAVPRISAGEFAAPPFLIVPLLSPDGNQVVARGYVGGKELLVVIAIDRKSEIVHRIPVPPNVDLRWYRWAGNERLLVSVGQSAKYMGGEVYATRLMMVDLKTDKGHFIGRKNEGVDGDDLVYVDPDGRSLLLSIQKTIYDYPSVWHVDLDTLAMKEIVPPRNGVWDWYADPAGVVRAGLGAEGRFWWLLYRKDANARFERVISRKVTKDEQQGNIERFIPMNGNDSGYAVANTATGRYGLYRYDFSTDTLGEAVFEHPTVDIDDFYQSPSGKIEAVYYTDDRRRVEWLDPRMKQLQADLDKALPGQINRVASISRDGQTMLVWTGGSSNPGRYYVYRPATGTMGLLITPYDRLAGKKLATMESTSYRARDGLAIPAYLTMPRGRPAKGLPLIVMPHGGPFVRDEWGYDMYAQFLANRGYIVLQPNFRGSTGYGKAFVEKGMGQWGRAMQDDLDDGVKWLVEQGKADGKRVCIMGTSYGGYAAMWASARNPEMYRCAISFAGISDVRAMLAYDRRTFSAPRYFRNWRERVQGDKDFDLDTISPLRAVDRMGIPLLIAHGEEDDNVPVTQSRKLHEALTKAGKAHEYIAYPGERHGLQSVRNTVDYLTRIEAFLAKHNPAD